MMSSKKVIEFFSAGVTFRGDTFDQFLVVVHAAAIFPDIAFRVITVTVIIIILNSRGFVNFV